MKVLSILALILCSNTIFANDFVVLDSNNLELFLKQAKAPVTNEGKLLKLILENTENLQLKDGTVLEIKDFTQPIPNVDSIRAIESGLKVLPGGGGTGAGG